MQVLPPGGFVRTPWKNGGGITHEIARDQHGAALRWRLSLAEVTTDGPFSTFAGFERILTVVSGAGMDLISPRTTLHARPAHPLAFAGHLPIEGRLLDGPVRNLNLIFDPRHCAPEASILVGPGILKPTERQNAVYVISGGARLGDTDLPQGYAAIFADDEITVPVGANVLHIALNRAE